ncbi:MULTISPECIES: HEPN domain-containing protein [Sphingobium]|uniref:hypothetical protein n=1 Tax=Sphingobium sp. MI1205 TaxID=407020 RepID=UPI00076FF5FA|nr:hypothetical protein [Sphingobium sp. MI1205]AMK18273.1 hypothetical protein K663_09465 [Sphingobium sp. MI1205]
MSDDSLERAQGYLRMSEDYAAAATRSLGSGADESCRLPFFMLVAHALELSLKAVLSAEGADEERLMGIGHELGWCLQLVRRTRRYPKEAFSELVRLVDALSTPHAFQAFRYPQPFRWTLPEPLAASGLLQRHLDVVAEAITRDRARSSL